MDPELKFTPKQIVTYMNNLHVYASRNCMWAPMEKIHHLIKVMVNEHNVTIPAMHYVEIPGLAPGAALANTRRISSALLEHFRDQARMSSNKVLIC
jgi:hypothetical protein